MLGMLQARDSGIVSLPLRDPCARAGDVALRVHILDIGAMTSHDCIVARAPCIAGLFASVMLANPKSVDGVESHCGFLSI